MSSLEQPPEDRPARPASSVIDMRDIPLGTLIHRAGLLTAEQLEGALAEGSSTGKRLGEVLIDRGLLQERQVAELVAGQKGLPFVEVLDAIDPEVSGLLPQIAARRYGAVAIGREDGVPVVAVADPANDEVVAFLEERLGEKYQLVVAARTEIERAALAVGPRAESPAAAAPAPAAPPSPTVEPPPAPAVEPPPAPVAVARTHKLVLRLLNGELIELGTFDDRATADASAAHVVQQLIAGEASGWLLFDGRYVRPGAIVSLDIL
jgi:hypothetical protein